MSKLKSVYLPLPGRMSKMTSFSASHFSSLLCCAILCEFKLPNIPKLSHFWQQSGSCVCWRNFWAEKGQPYHDGNKKTNVENIFLSLRAQRTIISWRQNNIRMGKTTEKRKKKLQIKWKWTQNTLSFLFFCVNNFDSLQVNFFCCFGVELFIH